jgi:hypothetical protein
LIAAIALMSFIVDDPFHGAEWITIPREPHAIESASWIWAQSSGTMPTTRGAAVGEVVLTSSIDVLETGKAEMWFACDNSCEVFVDGKHVGSTKDWSSLAHVTFEITNGRHEIKAIARNDPGTALNPAGLILGIRTGTQTFVTDRTWRGNGVAAVELGPLDTTPWSLRAPDDGACPIFRDEFTLLGKPDKATLRVIGLGHFQARVNGERIGKAALHQPWSEYDERIYFEEFDVSAEIREGENAVGFLLGNGFWSVQSPPGGRAVKGDAMPDFSGGAPYVLRFALELDFANGDRKIIKSGNGTKWARGPVTLSHIYAGEDFDKRLEPSGWAEPRFDESDWQEAQVIRPSPRTLEKRYWPALSEQEVFRPIDILHPREGAWSYVFSQNASALLRFRVRGRPGQTVRFKPSEVMTREGEVQQLNLWGKSATFDYTLASDQAETHQWLFHYNGFQYVEVTGAVPAGKPNPNGLPVIEALESIHVRTDNRESGRFKSSSQLYNDTHRIVDWAMKSNMSWVMTDCPHREKLGWLECAHLLMPTFAYRYDCRLWFKKLCADMRDAQLDTGRVLTVAPKYLMRPPDDIYAFTVEWAAASVLLPWQAYQWYGDRSFLEDNYAMMIRFVDHVASVSPEFIAPGRLGDWYDYGHGQSPGPSRFTPTDLSATACWALCIDALRNASGVLGRKALAKKYDELHDRVRRAFLHKFYNTETKTLANSGSPQTAHAMALCVNLVPESDRGAVLQAIIEDLERRDYQQTSGDVGHLYLIRALADAGRSDLLHKVYSRTGTGSYGGIIAKGLTTMPETWDAITVGSNSLNHCMLGHVMEWFYGWVLGIRQAEESLGWSRVLIAPEPGDLTSCSGYVATPKGRIDINWSKNAQGFELEVTVPEGTSALAVLPMGKSVSLNDKAVAAKSGPFGRLSIELPNGRHRILAKS